MVPTWLARVSLAFALLSSSQLLAQAVLHGRLLTEDADGKSVPLTAVRLWANPPGENGEGIPFRTWETAPSGWYRLGCPRDRYSVLFSTPHLWARPRLLTNVVLRDEENVELDVHGDLWLASFPERDWDREPARGYYQPFTARGESVTQIGFKLATDGVDGVGPGSQDFLATILRVKGDDPREWDESGPTMPVLSVDCGGPKSYAYSAGWRSGEVPTEVGATYAIWLRPSSSEGRAQAFWSEEGDETFSAYRVAGDGGVRKVNRRLWTAVAGDGDGLVLACNKRVHKPFPALTHLEHRWCQTWRAQGRGLAGVVLYAAVSGAQPPLARQRVRMFVRESSPQGPIVGSAKIATGNGDYTGDASWGAFGASWAPGETALEPGRTYCLDVESIETLDTIGGFVNIKGQMSDGRAGFNPYRKAAGDENPYGSAFRGGTERVEYDLDLQVIEYEAAVDPESWRRKTTGSELLANGDAETDGGWMPFTQNGAIRRLRTAASGDPSPSVLRAVAGEDGLAVADGGWVQRVVAPRKEDALLLRARVRASYPESDERVVRLGIDPTGQTDDPAAASIEWIRLPRTHGVWVEPEIAPVRPATDAVSVWLRLTQSRAPKFPFRADFDGLSLRRLDRDVPASPEPRTTDKALERAR